MSAPWLKYKEEKIEDYLKLGVESIGGLCLKFKPASAVGLPDRMVLLPGGVAAFVELKRPRKEPTRVQHFWLGRLRDLGFNATWFSSHPACDGFLEWCQRAIEQRAREKAAAAALRSLVV